MKNLVSSKHLSWKVDKLVNINVLKDDGSLEALNQKSLESHKKNKSKNKNQSSHLRSIT